MKIQNKNEKCIALNGIDDVNEMLEIRRKENYKNLLKCV